MTGFNQAVNHRSDLGMDPLPLPSGLEGVSILSSRMWLSWAALLATATIGCDGPSMRCASDGKTALSRMGRWRLARLGAQA